MTILLILLISVLLIVEVIAAILLIYMLKTGVHAITFTVERPQKRQEAQR